MIGRGIIATLVAAGALGTTAAALPAPGEAVIPARFAYRYDPAARCPDVRPAQADDAGVAVIVFRVGPTGVPSQAAVRASSGSSTLDAAALACVMRLRFRPATSMGDGTPIESWQQSSWKDAARPTAAAATAAAVVPAAAGAGNAVSAAGAGASDPGGAAGAAVAARQPGAVLLHLCVDGSGHLTAAPRVVQSSGDAQFDAAAVQVAAAGSGHYRAPGGGAGGGCEQLTLAPEGLPPH